jgi:site-specific recombinase XerD
MTTTSISFAPLLERFFTQRLMQQRQASPHTISSYRDTFRLLLTFAHQRLHTSPARLPLDAIDAPLVVAFLDQLERQRRLSVRSRNLRLTAIHSFFRYAAFEAPAHAAQLRGPWFVFSHGQRCRRCWRHLISAPGSAGAITRSS